MLTQHDFLQFKDSYDVYGTHTELDSYHNEHTVMDSEPKGSVFTMWQPLSDAAGIAEYGAEISRMFYGIVYDDPGVKHGDVISYRGNDYEIVGIKYFNTFTRVEIRKKDGT